MGEKERFQMGIDRIVQIAVVLALIASATGQLPKVIKKVQIAEFRLLQQSKTDTWGKLLIIKK